MAYFYLALPSSASPVASPGDQIWRRPDGSHVRVRRDWPRPARPSPTELDALPGDWTRIDGADFPVESASDDALRVALARIASLEAQMAALRRGPS